MTRATLTRQVGRPGPVLCHYRSLERRIGYKVSVTSYGFLLTFGGRGHYVGLGWMVR